MTKKTVIIGADHAGFALKKALISYVQNELQHEVVDMGATDFDENDDYPTILIPAVSRMLGSLENSVGIFIGGSGQGEAIVANRCKGIRAAVYNNDNLELIKLAREHNDTNVLSIGARFISEDGAKEAVALFLATDFSNEARHVRRIAQIDA